jgi:DNA repair exonuclease SbcCD nuclease subunit
MKFIHCADIHLDTPLQGLANYSGAPVNEIRNATRRAFERVLDVAVSEQIDFLIIAGDLYDTGLKSFESALFFNSQMSRLKDAGIDVYLIHGNHDAASKLIKQIRPPANVHVFKAAEPQTFKIESLRVAIHGQSFLTPEIVDDLAANYPPCVPDFFNIGVLHTNLAGAAEHANYAPCTLDTLKSKGYQYWALGHIHNRQILCTDPYIVYPGNIQGRHGKEQGEKSCELVTVSDTGTIALKTISTSVVPWIEIVLDASDCQTTEDVAEKFRTLIRQTLAREQQEDRIIALRLRIVGSSNAHFELNRDPEQVRSEAISVANEFNGLLWVERVQVATVPKLDRNALLQRDDPVGEVARIAAELRQDSSILASWDVVADLKKKLPADLVEGTEAIALDPIALNAALEEAESLLLARLSVSGTL